MPDLLAAVEELSPEQIDGLPFGVVRLDHELKVVIFNDMERRQSGYRKEVVNRSFFSEIAPCFNNPDFRGRIASAMAAGQLDIRFDYVADLPSGDRDVDIHVRIVATDDGGCWVFREIQD